MLLKTYVKTDDSFLYMSKSFKRFFKKETNLNTANECQNMVYQ